MTPVAFDGCFGWLHVAARGETAGASGVVMCGTLGFEKQVFHRSWRFLAERFAAEGYPTLRFDYPGSGDSRGLDCDPDAPAEWLLSIDRAVAWLRANAGVSRVVLCGIHLGALLAGVAASRIGNIDRLILLAPVPTGRSYARTVAMATKVSGLPPEAGYVEAYGLRLHQTTVQALQPLDLSRLSPVPAQSVLILSPAEGRGSEAIAASLTLAGAKVTVREMPDYLELTRPAHESAVPVASFDRILAWLRDSPSDLAGVAPGRPPRPIQVAELGLRDAVERPLMLGEDGSRLFGMLCQPVAKVPRELPDGSGRLAVVICNTGANPHFGYGRLAVVLARALAADGVASVRLDLAGLGDSDGASNVSLPELYADRSACLRAVTDFLQVRGYDRVVVFGICTGAFHALHAGLNDDRVAGVVLVNQIVYRWTDNALLFRLEVQARALLGRLCGEAVPDAEQDLMRLRIAPPNPTKNRVRRAALRVGVCVEGVFLRPLGLKTPLGFPSAALRSIAARGVRTLIVAGHDDYARSLLQAHFGSAFRGIRRFPGVRIEIEPAFDHPVGQSPARDRLIALVRDFIGELAPAPAIVGGAEAAGAEQQRRAQPARS